MKPCPNPECKKSRPMVHGDVKDKDFYVYCRACQTSGPMADTEDEAERLWDLLPRLEDDQRALKPCPNPDCLNDELTLEDIEGQYQVYCHGCGLCGPIETDVKLARNSWNNLPRFKEIEFTDVSVRLPPQMESVLLKTSHASFVIGHRVGGDEYNLDFNGEAIQDNIVGWKPLIDIT